MLNALFLVSDLIWLILGAPEVSEIVLRDPVGRLAASWDGGVVCDPGQPPQVHTAQGSELGLRP